MAEGDASITNAQSQQLRLISAAAHDMKTPLTLISGIASVLQKNNLTKDQQTQYLERIMVSSDRLLGLVEGLIGATKVHDLQSSLPLEPISVGNVIESVTHELEPYAKASGQRLEVRRTHKLPLVLSNRQALYRVLFNLLDNAIKYSEKGQKVVVRARNDRDKIRVSVRDFGIGVRKRDLERLLSNFGSITEPNPAHAGSSGLGLYIAQQLSRATGATLAVKTLGRGSSFYVRLPVAKQLEMF